jgi:hypothetical protein
MKKLLEISSLFISNSSKNPKYFFKLRLTFFLIPKRRPKEEKMLFLLQNKFLLPQMVLEDGLTLALTLDFAPKGS